MTATIEVLDAAYWMKGCSSLGRLRFAVLLRVGTGKKRDDEFCLIDIKEATAAAAPRATRAVMPKDHAQRVVEGAKHLSPALGDRMMAGKLLERSVVIRELMPQDLKLEIDQLSREEAVNSARYLAEVVGKAHARQMDASTRREFASSFNQRKAARLNAPSWLWSSVVELASAHEAAYLEHCRRMPWVMSNDAARQDAQTLAQRQGHRSRRDPFPGALKLTRKGRRIRVGAQVDGYYQRRECAGRRIARVRRPIRARREGRPAAQSDFRTRLAEETTAMTSIDVASGVKGSLSTPPGAESPVNAKK